MPVEIIKPPKVAVLKTTGVNCDQETRYAFEKAGATAEIIHFSQFINGEAELLDFSILVLPGGFSWGDIIRSGAIWAVELKKELEDTLGEYHFRQRVIMGICNGFQVLVEDGHLPFGEIQSLDKVKATLTKNTSRRFESRWVYVASEESISPLIRSDEVSYFPVAHGEGRFVTDPRTLNQIEQNGQVVLRYSTNSGNPAENYPDNPNGSMNNIAGITDPTGTIVGLMPHPERNVERYHHPNFRRIRNSRSEPDGLRFFRNIVSFAKQL